MGSSLKTVLQNPFTIIETASSVLIRVVQKKQLILANLRGVAGHADILVAPDLVSGNILAKMLTFVAHADAAGVVLGARCPIILTSRADAERTRIASCAVAVLMARQSVLGVKPPAA